MPSDLVCYVFVRARVSVPTSYARRRYHLRIRHRVRFTSPRRISRLVAWVTHLGNLTWGTTPPDLCHPSRDWVSGDVGGPSGHGWAQTGAPCGGDGGAFHTYHLVGRHARGVLDRQHRRSTKKLSSMPPSALGQTPGHCSLVVLAAGQSMLAIGSSHQANSTQLCLRVLLAGHEIH